MSLNAISRQLGENLCSPVGAVLSVSEKKKTRVYEFNVRSLGSGGPYSVTNNLIQIIQIVVTVISFYFF